MTNRSIALARLGNSRLVGPPLATAGDAVRWFGAVQSQDIVGAFWALAQRMPAGTTIEDVGAVFDTGEIVRTHALRPTWHFLAPEELRWIQALTGPRVRQANASLNRRALHLTDADFGTAIDVIRRTLRGGRTAVRDDFRAPLATTGVPVADPIVLAYLAMEAELTAVICSGPRLGTQATTYALVDERIPPAPERDRDSGLRDLTVRYFTSHGPALVHDMSWWSGLTITDVRRGIELAGDVLETRELDGKRYVAGRSGFQPADVPRPHVLMLSNYDEAVGLYTDYSPMFDEGLPRARTVADVLGAHIVVRDGVVVGGWRRAFRGRRAIATVTLLIGLTRAERRALESEAERWARFLGRELELVVRTE